MPLFSRTKDPWSTWSNLPKEWPAQFHWLYSQPIEHVPSGEAHAAFRVSGRWSPTAITAIVESLDYLLPTRVGVMHPKKGVADFLVYLGPPLPGLQRAPGERRNAWGSGGSPQAGVETYRAAFARAQAALLRGLLIMKDFRPPPHSSTSVVAPPGTPSAVLWKIRSGSSTGQWMDICGTVSDYGDEVQGAEGWTKCRHGWAGYLDWVEKGAVVTEIAWNADPSALLPVLAELERPSPAPGDH